MHYPALSQQFASALRQSLATRLAALLFFLAAPALASDLPASVSAALKEAGIPERSVAVVVQGVDQAQPLLRERKTSSQAPRPRRRRKRISPA